MLAVSLFLARNWKKGGGLLFCSVACIAACVIPTAITGNTVKATVSAEVDGEDFDLVNIFEQLPEERKSKNPQNRFFDAGI